MATLTQQSRSDDLDALLSTLPEGIRRAVCSSGEAEELLEVVLDLGRRPYARYLEGEVELRESEVTQIELQLVVSQLGDFGADTGPAFRARCIGSPAFAIGSARSSG